ncbi:MAG: HAMP domain-containing histidine kinase [Bacteroidetes bacterium]|nr:HAMP domain-containing histidine kinase [Bacteroidota bacterium]
MFGIADTKNYIKQIPALTMQVDSFYVFSEPFYEVNETVPEMMDYSSIVFQTNIYGKIYQIKLSHSLTESNEIIKYISLIVALFLLISTLILIGLNTYLSKTIWAPFHHSLSKINNWDTRNTLKLSKTNITEFNILNNALIDLTNRIILDFKNMREFTQNISHESQTPLAIIKNKIVLLNQQENNPQQVKLLSEMHEMLLRISRLNKTLILISRIENRQYIEKEEINIHDFIIAKIEELADFTEEKNITVACIEKHNQVILVNKTLFDVLVNNLFMNAVKYNTEDDGKIEIELQNDALIFKNTSYLPPITDSELFTKIVRQSASGSLGIGLTIVKRICEFQNWDPEYEYKNNLHCFKIIFHS